jgi:hypothetical protein
MCDGLPNPSSIFAQEGTTAHAVGEMCLAQGDHPSQWIGEIVEGMEVTAEMAEAVTVYYDYVRGLLGADDELYLERRVSLEKLNPPVQMFGTSDCIIYRKAEKKLFVIDYKHGAGVAVEATGNPQGRYYALGAMLALENDQPVAEVEIIIVQPRAPHSDGPIRSETVSAAELVDFAADLMDAAHRTLDEDAPIVPGDHCKFCTAAGVCPGLREQALAVAQSEFGPPDPRTLLPEQVAELLQKADIVEEWVKSLRAHAYATLERGGTVPGFKLVAKRATRKWVNEQDAIAVLENSGGIRARDMYEQKLKSPAQVEKLLAKADRKLLAELTVSVSTGLTMVSETDKRQAAALSAADEFTALP